MPFDASPTSPVSGVGVLDPCPALGTDLVGARDREVVPRTEPAVAGRVAHATASLGVRHNSDAGARSPDAADVSNRNPF